MTNPEPDGTRESSSGVAKSTEQRELIGRLVSVFLFPLVMVSMMVAGSLLTTHDPDPRDLPIALSGSGAAIDDLMAAVDAAEPGAVAFQIAESSDAGSQLVLDRDVAGSVSIGVDGVATVSTAGAAGPSQAALVQSLVAPHLLAAGLDVEPVDVAPLSANDSGGVAVLFLASAFIMAGYLPMSLLLSASPKTLHLRRIVPLLAGWAAAMSVLIWFIVGPVLGAVEGHVLPVIGVGALAIMTVGLVQVFFTRVLGPMASLAAVLFITVLGGPASGLTSSIHTMPGFYSVLQHFLPTPATGQALRSIIYFDGDGVWSHLIVLIVGGVAAFVAIALIDLRRRRQGKPDPKPTMFSLTGGSKAHSRRGRYVAIFMFPILMIVLMLSTILASAYQPSPKDMPVAIVAASSDQARSAVEALEQDLGETFDLRPLDSEELAADQVRSRDVVAAYVLPDGGSDARLAVNQAAGASQAQLVKSIFGQVAAGQGAALTVDDLVPLDERDSAGSVSMGVGQGWIMAGILIVVVAGSAAPAFMRLRTLIPILVGWALAAPILIWLIAGPMIGALEGHFLPLFGVGAASVFCASLITLAFTRFMGLYAVIPAVGLLVFLGTPASGGALSIYMAPEVFRMLHDILPMPAVVEAIKSILYFGSDTVPAHLFTLALWASIALAAVIVTDRFKPVRTEPLTADDAASNDSRTATATGNPSGTAVTASTPRG